MIIDDILGLKLTQAIEFLEKQELKYEIIDYIISDYRFELSQSKRVVAVVNKTDFYEIYVALEQEAVL